MIEREVIGDATVYLGDAMEVLPTLELVDLICTDAPYRVTTGGSGQRERMDRGAARNISQFGGWMAGEYTNDGEIVTCDIDWADWMPAAFAVLREDSHAYFMSNGKSLFDAHSAAIHAGDIYDESGELISSDGFELHTVLVWDKRAALPNRWYQNITEFTLFMRKGKAFTINDPSSKNLISIFQRDESRHPTEKPVELMAYYIRNSSQPGQTVLDPFMGSGTTGVAALREGCKFIGVELDRKWFDVACKRLESAQSQGQLFGRAP